MNNLNHSDNKMQGITLGGKAKEFEWSYDGDKIIINRTIGQAHNKIQCEFKNKEISLLLSYIKSKGRVYLSNSVSKIQDGTEKDGIGKFIFENIKADISLAQAASQLVSIFVSAKVLDYNGKKRNMEFWVIDENWENAISK